MKGKLLFTIILVAILTSWVIYTRIKYHDPYLYSWDSVQFALSLESFDVSKHQPHPPGYLLYSYSLRALNLFWRDPNLTMITLNIAATLGACIFLALLISELTYDRFLAFFSAVLYATNPIVWMYGCVAEIYAVEGFFVALIMYSLFASLRRPTFILWSSFLMAVAGGFRPSTEGFLLPIYIAFLARAQTRLLCVSILICANLAWLIPLMLLTGGPAHYFEILTRQALVTAQIQDLSTRDILLRLMQAISIPVLIAIFLRGSRMRVRK
ncbi:MAG: hypothetical protein C5B54_02320, partial [Acidobacteria bacterium]